jgi:hypothetical protein
MITPPSHRLILFIFLFSAIYTYSQDWEFSKEKDGIKIYTRAEPGSHFKSFKGEMDLKADAATICSIIEDVASFSKCDEDVNEIKVLAWDKGKSLKYYVTYDVPWPFKDRDLYVEAIVSDEPGTGAKMIRSKSVPKGIPEDEDNVRIIDYWQNWTIQPIGNEMVHITMEGYADPAGDIPAWVANLAITDTPLNMLTALKKTVEK